MSRVFLDLENPMTRNLARLPILGAIAIKVIARQPNKITAGSEGKQVCVQRKRPVNREILGLSQDDAFLYPACSMFIVPSAYMLHPKLLMAIQVCRGYPHNSK